LGVLAASITTYSSRHKVLVNVTVMSKFFSKLKGEKAYRSDLTSSSDMPTSSSNHPYRQQDPPAYAPPPGPPPSHYESSSTSKKQSYPAQPTADDGPPPYHDWTSVPDTALLPPPPAITNEYSTTSNASYDEAARAHAWCAHHPVYQPGIPNQTLIDAVCQGHHTLDIPQTFTGKITKLNPLTSPHSFSPNTQNATPSMIYHISTQPTTSTSRFSTRTPPPPADQTISTLLPLYFASTSSSNNPKPRTIYFELTPLSYTSSEASVSIAYLSKPYPPSRQPGWHRASLAIHSDDGNKYINDPTGGLAFAAPIQPHTTVGLGMTFTPPPLAPQTQMYNRTSTPSQKEVQSPLPRYRTRVFFTRDGVLEGEWNVDEEKDAEMERRYGGVEGLRGEADLYAAVGTFGIVEVEVRFFEEGGA